jgi:hypothetical protein
MLNVQAGWMNSFNHDQQSLKPARSQVDDRHLAAVPASTPTLRESRDSWLREGRRRQLSPETRQSYRESTDEFLTVVGPHRTTDSLTAQDLDRHSLCPERPVSRARPAQPCNPRSAYGTGSARQIRSSSRTAFGDRVLELKPSVVRREFRLLYWPRGAAVPIVATG